MGVLINEIIYNPYYDLVVVFCLVAAFGFIIFLAGFLSGLQHLFKIDENVENLVSYRTRAFWGATILVVTLVAWECLRWVISLFV